MIVFTKVLKPPDEPLQLEPTLPWAPKTLSSNLHSGFAHLAVVFGRLRQQLLILYDDSLRGFLGTIVGIVLEYIWDLVGVVV